MRNRKYRVLVMMLGPLSFIACAPNTPSTTETIQSAAQALTDDGTWNYDDSILMKTARQAHAAIALSNGRAFVLGGTQDPTLAGELFLFDPKNGSAWTPLPSAEKLGIVGDEMCRPGMAQLDDDTLLVVATNAKTSTTSVWTYALPPNDKWTNKATLPKEACMATVVALENNRALILTTDKVTDEVSSFIYDAGTIGPKLMMPVPAAGTWAGFSAIRLYSGNVLVSGGGKTQATLTNESILYDTMNNAWVPAGNMNFSRAGHASALLPNGAVLVMGGVVTGPFNGLWGDTAEIFDIQSMAWATTTPMLTQRSRHTATTLSNGLVLVIGGSSSSTAELFDASTHSWTALESANDFRFFGHQATSIDGGPVLVTGGLSSDGGMTSPASNSVVTCEANSLAWEDRASLSELSERGYHSATLLESGQLLVVGGVMLDDAHQFSNPLDAAYTYEENGNTWTDAATPAEAHALHTATKLLNGQVLVAGGWQTAVAEIFNPETNAWESVASLPKGIMRATATLLPGDKDDSDGRVLHVGGVYSDGKAFTASEVLLFDPDTKEWTSGPELTQGTQTSRFGHTATLLNDGTVLVVGGAEITTAGSINTPVADAAYFNPKDNTWTAVASMNTPRAFHSATLLADGRVLVAGGGIPSAFTSNGVIEWSTIYISSEIYDPTANTWTAAASMLEARTEHEAVLLEKGHVLIAGGRSNNYGGILASAEIFDPYGKTWTPTSRMQTPRFGHTLTLLDGGVMAVGGFHPFSSTDNAPERFPQAANGSPCSTDDQCVSTFCADSICCDKACDSPCLACSAKLGSSADGTCETVKDCGNYACVLNTGACLDECSSIDDCATGYVCDPDKACINPLKNASTLDEASCTAASPTQSNAPPWPSLMLAACAFAWRRHHTRKIHRKS